MGSSCRTIEQSLQEYGRGVAGGLIFSLPLLFTMEMWWTGFIAPPQRQLAGLIGTFLLLIGYNRYAGLRRDASLKEVIIDSVEELGLGLVLATAMLFLLGRAHGAMPLDAIIGQIVTEALTIAIGVSVGTAQLGTSDEGDSGMGESVKHSTAPSDDEDDVPSFKGQILLALCGAVLFAANVAPTEEIEVLAFENTPLHLLLTVGVSLLLATLILKFSAFRGSGRFTIKMKGLAVLQNVIVTYAIALAASALILWYFGRFDGNARGINLAQVIILGFPAVLGASAGRLLVQGNQS